MKRGADLGADPIQYSPAVTRGFESSDMPISARFPHTCVSVGMRGREFCTTIMAESKFKCMQCYFVKNISPLIEVLDLIHAAVTDPCHEDGVIPLKK